jgi:hypothetical protein
VHISLLVLDVVSWQLQEAAVELVYNAHTYNKIQIL